MCVYEGANSFDWTMSTFDHMNFVFVMLMYGSCLLALQRERYVVSVGQVFLPYDGSTIIWEMMNWTDQAYLLIRDIQVGYILQAQVTD